jgi:hypothetical protein
LQEHNPQPRPAPHKFDHDIRTLSWRPDFHRNGSFSIDKNEGRCRWQPCQQGPLFTTHRWLNVQSQGTMKFALAFSRTKSAHNNQLEMALEDSSSAAVAFKRYLFIGEMNTQYIEYSLVLFS